jgi:hypothetical protein
LFCSYQKYMASFLWWQHAFRLESWVALLLSGLKGLFMRFSTRPGTHIVKTECFAGSRWNVADEYYLSASTVNMRLISTGISNLKIQNGRT